MKIRPTPKISLAEAIELINKGHQMLVEKYKTPNIFVPNNWDVEDSQGLMCHCPVGLMLLGAGIPWVNDGKGRLAEELVFGNKESCWIDTLISTYDSSVPAGFIPIKQALEHFTNAWNFTCN